MKKIDLLIYSLLFTISVFTLKDLFKPGFFTSHDGPNQVVRFYYFDQIMREGQIPPRFVGGLLNGYGYPLFEFSYHMPWIIAEVFHLLSFSLIDSIKLTFFAGFFLSSITMYSLQKELFGRFAALVGSFIYLFAPYRFLNIFVRAALGDATTFIFAPLIFFAFYIFHKKEHTSYGWIAVGSIAFAAMLLSHAMVFFLFCISFLIYWFFCLVLSQKRKPFFIQSAIMVLLGFGLSSYYLIPSLLERGMTQFSDIVKMYFINSTFIDFRQLLYSPWGYGAFNAQYGAMSIQLGVTQWVIIILSAGLTILHLISKKKNGKLKRINLEIISCELIFILTIFLMLPISKPVWTLLNIIGAVDFTWRILAVAVFVISILAGYLVYNVRNKYIFGVLLILLAAYANRNHIHINQSLNWPANFYLKLEKTTNTFDEYMPHWVRNESVDKPAATKAILINTQGNLKLINRRSNYMKFNALTNKDGLLRINTIYYPGWSVSVNGKDTAIKYKDSGFIDVNLKKGKSIIIAKFNETPLRLLSDIVSFISLTITICLLAYHIVKRYNIRNNISVGK